MRIIIVGFGVVGRAFARLLRARSRDLRDDYGLDVHVVAASDSRGTARDPKGLRLDRIVSLKEKGKPVGGERADTVALIKETEADVVVELTPTDPRSGEPGLRHITSALESGKHVVTANKGPLVVAYPRLRRFADARSLKMKYSAAVGGGNPVLAFGDSCASSEPVIRVEAILNRTTNYILTEMEEKRIPFSKALKEARRIGLAEPDPSLDVDGIDQACKLVIIANHVLRRDSYFRDVSPIESIRGVSMESIEEAKKRGKRIRMVGMIDRRIEVRLTELDAGDPFAIRGTADITRFHCKLSGPKMVASGVGGPSYTAAGMLRDLVEIHSSRKP